MPAPRLLVIGGNTAENRANHVAAGGTVASAGYAALLQELLPGAVVDISFPADPGANLPNGQALEGYDGVAITGSGLHVYEASPAVTNQIELTRAALKSGTPVFGSCWGLQDHPEYPLREIAAIVRRVGLRLIDEGFFLDTKEIAAFADDLVVLDRNPAEMRLSWRYGISKNVLDKKLRTGEVANWLEYQVLPTRAKRGRG